jgi:hypothetical protein
MQCWGIVSVPVRLYDDLHVLIERHEKTQKPFDGKLPKLPAQHLGYVVLANAKEIGRLDLFQVTIFHDSVDFEDQLRLDKVLLGIWNADIFEHIPASGFVPLLSHGSLSFACNPLPSPTGA